MKALKINVDFKTGKRAGGIDPKSPNFRGHSTWQDFDAGTEVRLVLDENVEKYRNVAGITVLDTEADIEAELDANFKPKVVYKITNPALMSYSLSKLNIDLSGLLKDASDQDELAFLYAANVKGIQKITKTRESASSVKG